MEKKMEEKQTHQPKILYLVIQKWTKAFFRQTETDGIWQQDTDTRTRQDKFFGEGKN